jgi:NAD(P)-dependent dehydrogenase (short-subunit alcohol dehydrogenase family)
MRFTDKVAIVTGGGSGIGLATAGLFYREGARVVIAERDEGKAQAAIEQLDAADPTKTLGLGCDVASEPHVISAVEATIGQFGRLDIVVNCAGVMIFKPLEEQTLEDWQRVLDVDLLGAFYFTKHAFLRMKQGGSIVNVSSIHAVETAPLVSAYAAAKAALLSLTRSAQLEGKSRNIRVNAVLPGAVDTPMLWENPNVKSGLEHIDRGMVGTAENVAQVIAYLASSEAEFVCGAAVIADGGRLGKL